MKIQIALLTGMMALSTSVSVFACGGSSGYQVGGYSNSGYHVTGYGYTRPACQANDQVVPAASWHTPVPAAYHSTRPAPAASTPAPAPAMPSARQATISASRDLMAPPAPPTIRRTIAVPSVDATAQSPARTTGAKNTAGLTRTLTSEETIALLKLLGPQDLQ